MESAKPKEEIKHESKPEKGTPLDGLRGVIDNTQKVEVKPPVLSSGNYPLKPVSDCLPTDIKVENPEYKKWNDRKVVLETEIKREHYILLDIDRRIGSIESAKNPTKSFHTKKNFVTSSDMYQLRDFFPEEELKSNVDFENNNQNKVKEYRQMKEDCQKMLGENKTRLNHAVEILSKIPRYMAGQKPKPSLLDILEGVKRRKLQQEEKTEIAIGMEEPRIETKENENTIGETESKIETNSRIISSKELMKLDYKSLNFQNMWKDFLGQPAVIFHFAVHGLPGGGKSTFCLQLADYLADNFGNVMYVSGEEGYSKTLKDKVILTKADSNNLYFHDAKNIDDIKEYVPADQYHFIFIDSLDTLRIDAIKLRQLREHYYKSAFITISQSRKDGKMKGDNEILHDADTIIAVHNGTATLSKNRFGSISDKHFEVFPKSLINQEKSKLNAHK